MVTHTTTTGDTLPQKQVPRRLPHTLQGVVEKQVREMLEQEVNQPSVSPWSSPVVLVRKIDNTYQFCVDYRKLNGITVKDAYPLPRVDETLESLGGASYFSTLDLASGYWQVAMDPEDKKKTAFSTKQGHFEFNVMPFGLCNAPATFQRLMEYILAGLQWDHCLVYLDDIVVFSTTFDQHVKKLRAVFSRLSAAGLKLKPSKCYFGQKSVNYLGHVVGVEGLQPDQRKVQAVMDFPRPVDGAGVRWFLGLVGYYRRFIPHFSSVAAPLFKIQSSGAHFDWTDDCQQPFEVLKHKLTAAPVMAFPRFEEDFVLTMDASEVGLGSVLSQKYCGGEHVVAYASRVLHKAEKNYSTTERKHWL